MAKKCTYVPYYLLYFNFSPEKRMTVTPRRSMYVFDYLGQRRLFFLSMDFYNRVGYDALECFFLVWTCTLLHKTVLHSIGAVFETTTTASTNNNHGTIRIRPPLSGKVLLRLLSVFRYPFPPPLSMNYYFTRPRTYYNRRKDEVPAADVAYPTRRPPRPRGPRRSTSACRCSWECASSSP